MKATTTRQTFKIEKLRYRNQTDFTAARFKAPLQSVEVLKELEPDIFEACYYVIETPQYLYREGTVRMRIDKQTNVDLMLFSGPTMASVVEGGIIEESTEDGSETWYSVDFTQLMVLVVTPSLN